MLLEVLALHPDHDDVRTRVLIAFENLLQDLLDQISMGRGGQEQWSEELARVS